MAFKEGGGYISSNTRPIEVISSTSLLALPKKAKKKGAGEVDTMKSNISNPTDNNEGVKRRR